MNQYKVSSIPDNGCMGLKLQHGDSELKIIALRMGAEIICYLNSCPHTGVNLEWTPDQFLDASGELIQCATHGALFQREDGYCISGSCTGAYLGPVKVEIHDEMFEISL
jgi:nitrite reductase/ring-hydroxylating ferredoxin subunit